MSTNIIRIILKKVFLSNIEKFYETESKSDTESNRKKKKNYLFSRGTG